MSDLDRFSRDVLFRLNDLEERLKRVSGERPGNFTTGSVLFGGSDGRITQDNANLSWDDSGNILSINGVSFPVAVGTFTPTFQGSGTAGAWTYSIQTGFYTRIGNRVLFNLSIAATVRGGAPTGDAWIVGLPFNSNSTANSHSPVSIDTLSAVTIGGTTIQVTARVPPSATRVELVEVIAAGVALLPATSLTATAFIRVAGSYMI